MATAPTDDELIAQAQAATTTEQLDALQAESDGRPAVLAQIQARRDQLGTQQPAAAARPEPPLGSNMATDPPNPKAHYYVMPDGRHVNAWGEEKGSAEDKKRW